MKKMHWVTNLGPDLFGLLRWLTLACLMVSVASSAMASIPAKVDMTLRVTVPSNTPSSDTIWLRQLNAGLNEQDIQMAKVAGESNVWQGTVSAPQDTIFRYGYRRSGDWNKAEIYPPAAADGGFFYREVLARNGASISDTVAQWQDLPLISGSTGTLQGLVTDPGGSPLMGIRVSAGPHQVMTRWDGSYRVSGVPSGPTEITLQADNGEYFHARMSAIVSSSGATTVNATLTAAAMASVTFQVTVPASTPPAAIPRLFGDTYHLGMFQGFQTGAVHPTRVIDMTYVSGSTWSYTANLGVGTCVNYSYTLGAPNAIRNNEVGADGNPWVRSLCVTGNITVTDTVTAWKGLMQVPVTLTVTSPTADILYVTADVGGGSAPMRMWPTGTGTATYVLYADPNTTLRYRYMRNGDNSTGMEILPPGDQNPPLYRSLAIGPNGATSSDTITAWRHQMRETALTTVQTGTTGPIVPRLSGSFQTGVEFNDYWNPDWQALIRPSVARLKSKNVKWVQIASVWGIMSMDTPRIEQGWNSFSTEDLINHIREIKMQGMNVALRILPFTGTPAAEAGFKVSHSNEWYDLFFDEVKAMAMFHARIAQQEGVELLILENFSWDFAVETGVTTSPATRAYINNKFKSIIADIRSIAPSVKLTTSFLIPFDEYDWYADLDYLGDKWWVPLASTDNASVSDMYAVAMDRLKTLYQPISARFSNKPFLFSEVAFYSANTSAMQQYGVYAPEIDDFAPAVATPVSDYDEQARAYQATLLAFAATPWVQGCYSFGYDYFDFDQKGYSVRSKTAEEIMSQIYQRFNDRSGPMSPLNLASGWNLIGNSVNAPLDVTTTLADASKVTSVWKWVSTGAGKWAFFSPSLAGQALSDYAAGKGYDVLTTINGGEGFWVNANTAFTAQLPAGAAVTSTSFQNMSPGWHLIATGDTQTPSGFNTNLSVTPPAAGVVPQNMTSLWTWDNAQSKWYFYAPSLEAQGGTALTDYITSHGYLDFTSANKTLGLGVGFWVNMP